MSLADDIRERLQARAESDPAAAARAEALLDFRASQSFIGGFRKRHKMSLRRPSFKRRPDVDETAIEAFILKVRDLLKVYPPDRVINIDETNWRMVNTGFLTWAKRGSKTVQCHIENDDKYGVTAIAGIDAMGNKLPLTVIGKGNTRRCLTRFGLGRLNDVRGVTSPSGWTTGDVMCEYLTYLREEPYPTGPLVVILDVYPAHRTDMVRATAYALGIELVFIPPGCTDRLQPLDRRVFGVLKVYARQPWRRHNREQFGDKMTREQIAQNLSAAWDIDWGQLGGDDGPSDDDTTDTLYVPEDRTEDLIDN
jgi:hypothetical protein